MKVSRRRPAWQNGPMARTRTLHEALAELRALGATRHKRSAGMPDVAPLLVRLLSQCRALSIEERAAGFAFRLAGSTGKADYSITCLLSDPRSPDSLTTAEQAVAAQLCEGHTIAQIASARGVSPNTVKSQVRQIFRKLNVESRVALVRLMCP